MSASPYLVHTEETNRPSAPCDSYGDHLRASCSDEFDSAKRIYEQIDPNSDRNFVWRLSTCRNSAWFTRNSHSGEVRVAAKTCHLRWCPLCSDARRNFISFAIREWVEKLKYPKFLTLTLRHNDLPLQAQVENLYRHFRQLRRKSHFKKLVTGGVWFFQIKKSRNDGRWHPHLHCLIGGLYIPHAWLSKTWSEITFGSTVVDIRPINDPRKACNDAARYAASPGSLSGLSLSDGLEMVEAMHGRRICGTWGTARRVSLRPAKISETGTWESVGSWDSVFGLRKSNRSAEAIFLSWRDHLPLPPGIDVCRKDKSTLNQFMIDIDQYDLDEIYPPERGPPYES